MKIALITDAWRPQTNGVVTTLMSTLAALRRLGHETLAITPQAFRTVGCPTYPEIRLALFAGRGVARELERFAPDAVHIATEGPLGQAGRARSCSTPGAWQSRKAWKHSSSSMCQAPST